jgi:transposase InsO family protein/transposase-like protein
MPYSQSFKKEILAQCRGGDSVSAIAKEYHVPRSTIYRWLKEEHLVETSEKVYSVSDIKALERRIAKLEKINAILKTVPCTVHAPLRERLNALEQLHGEYDVHTLCEALDVSRGTYYNHIRRNKRDGVWYKMREEEYRILIRDVFYEFDQVLGANKICAVLKERGHAVTPKYVARIMDDLGLASIRTDAKRIYDSQRKKPSNILQQQFTCQAPNKVWISDVTCFKFGNHWFYICAIMDLYSRMVVGCHIGKSNSSQLLGAAIRKAYESRHPSSGLIFHSDRGRPYCSKAFLTKLDQYSMVQSLSRTGKPHDNAVMESFFSSMKREALYRREYPSEAAFRQGVSEYIEFYNTKRPHRSQQHKTPVQFEQAYYEKHPVSRQGSDG